MINQNKVKTYIGNRLREVKGKEKVLYGGTKRVIRVIK